MKVTLIGRTAFNSEIAFDLTDGWEGTAQDTDAALLTEFAGRACYQSWTKPNAATAMNPDYLRHIIEIDHTSVFEHGSLTFYIEDVSRTLTHEFIRHRHLSPSQLSQRFVKLGDDSSPVIPPLYAKLWEPDPMQPVSETQGIVEEVWTNALKAYERLVSIWEERLVSESADGRITTHIRKRAREAARCVLPNMTPTSIVMSGNHRAWRHFLEMRGSLHADAEIRELAVHVYGWAMSVEPALYQDFRVCRDADEGDYLERVRYAAH